MSDALGRVRVVWARRTATEYRSAVLGAELLSWTLRLGLSPDLVRGAHGLVGDEFAHAELSYQVYAAAGGEQDALPMPAEWLGFPHAPDAPPLLRALVVAADEYALAETVALEVAKEIARGSLVAPVEHLCRKILADEARHAAFGWALLGELLELAGDEGRAGLRPQLPGCIDRIRQAYATGVGDCTAAELSWGMLPAEVYTEVVARGIAIVERRLSALSVWPARESPGSG